MMNNETTTGTTEHGNETPVIAQSNANQPLQNDKLARLHKNLMIMKKKVINTGLLIEKFEDTKKKLDVATVQLEEYKRAAQHVHSMAQLNKRTQQQIGVIRTENEQLKKDYETSQTMLKEERNGIAILKTKITQLEQRLQHSQKMLADKSAECQKLVMNAKAIDQSELIKQVKDLEVVCESLQKELNQTREENNRIRSQDPALYKPKTSSKIEIHRLQLRIVELEEQNKKLQERIPDEEELKENSNIKTSNKRLTTQLDRLKRENKQLTDENAKLLQQIERPQNQHVRTVEVPIVDKNLAATNEALRNTNAKLLKRIGQLKHIEDQYRSTQSNLAVLKNAFITHIQPLISGSGAPAVNHIPVTPIERPRNVISPSPIEPASASYTLVPVEEIESEPLGGFGFEPDVESIQPPVAETKPATTPKKQAPTTPKTQPPKKKSDNKRKANSVTLPDRSVQKKRKLDTSDFVEISMERQTQEKTEGYVLRLITTYIDAYSSMLANPEHEKYYKRIYVTATKLCMSIWNNCHGDENSSIGSALGVKAVVRALCDTIVNTYILNQADDLKIDMLLQLVILFHLHSPVNADIFAHMYEIIQLLVFPSTSTKANTPRNIKETEALCSAVSMISQIDILKLPAKKINSKKALKVVAAAKPFNLSQSLQGMIFDIVCLLVHKKQSDPWNLDLLRVLFALLSSNPKLIQGNNYVSQSIIAILKQILLELQQKSEDEGLVASEQKLYNLLEQIFVSIGVEVQHSDLFDYEDYVDQMIDILISAVRALPAEVNQQEIGLSQVQHDIVNSFIMIAHLRNDWMWMYNNILFGQLWPLTTESGAISVVVCIVGAVAYLKLKGVLIMDEENCSSGMVEIVKRLLCVINSCVKDHFTLQTQLSAINQLLLISTAPSLACELDGKLDELNLHKSIVQWLDEHSRLKDDKDVIEHFAYVQQMLCQIRNFIAVT